VCVYVCHLAMNPELTKVSSVNLVNYLDIISVNYWCTFIHCIAGCKFVLVDFIISIHSCKLSQYTSVFDLSETTCKLPLSSTSTGKELSKLLFCRRGCNIV